jgi:WD40 repeat protein
MSEAVEIIAGTSHINDVLFTHDSQLLVSAGMDGLIKLWSTRTWAQVGEIRGHEKSVNMLSLSPAGDLLVSGSSDKTVRIWRFPDGSEFASLPVKASGAHLSPDGKWLATTSDTRLRLYNFPDLNPVWEKKLQKREIHALKFSPGGDEISVAGMRPDIRTFACQNGGLLASIKAHDPFVMSLAYSPDGRILASSGYEDGLKIWSLHEHSERQRHALDRKGVLSVSIAPDNDTLAVSMDHRVELFSIHRGSRMVSLELSPKGVYQSAFSPDGRWLAVAAADKRVRIWRLPIC